MYIIVFLMFTQITGYYNLMNCIKKYLKVTTFFLKNNFNLQDNAAKHVKNPRPDVLVPIAG